MAPVGLRLAGQLLHLLLARAVPHIKRMESLHPQDATLCCDLQLVHMQLAKAQDVKLIESLYQGTHCCASPCSWCACPWMWRALTSSWWSLCSPCGMRKSNAWELAHLHPQQGPSVPPRCCASTWRPCGPSSRYAGGLLNWGIVSCIDRQGPI